jgi:hypothetical protein
MYAALLISIMNEISLDIPFQIVYEPVEFPSLTFCNLNNIMNTKLSLGGEGLAEVLRGIEDAQEEAMTGVPAARRRRKRGAKGQEDGRRGEGEAGTKATNRRLRNDEDSTKNQNHGYKKESEKRRTDNPGRRLARNRQDGMQNAQDIHGTSKESDNRATEQERGLTRHGLNDMQNVKDQHLTKRHENTIENDETRERKPKLTTHVQMQNTEEQNATNNTEQNGHTQDRPNQTEYNDIVEIFTKGNVRKNKAVKRILNRDKTMKPMGDSINISTRSDIQLPVAFSVHTPMGNADNNLHDERSIGNNVESIGGRQEENGISGSGSKNVAKGERGIIISQKDKHGENEECSDPTHTLLSRKKRQGKVICGSYRYIKTKTECIV